MLLSEDDGLDLPRSIMVSFCLVYVVFHKELVNIGLFYVLEMYLRCLVCVEHRLQTLLCFHFFPFH